MVETAEISKASTNKPQHQIILMDEKYCRFKEMYVFLIWVQTVPLRQLAPSFKNKTKKRKKEKEKKRWTYYINAFIRPHSKAKHVVLNTIPKICL